ncbi:MAG: glycosyltransferase family 2 protein [Candidatus Babeliaceae bacterium]|nr:glycosyltransferase family 2 protein [Candidatus Babeliaceae bacterium]
MKQLFKILFFVLISYALSTMCRTEFEIIIPTYNNEPWCISNLEALVSQTYPHWHATVIVDCATDKTAELISDYIIKNNLENKITLIINTERKGALANIYYAVTMCSPHKVIGLYDGDDKLAGDFVLAHLADLYDTYDIWVTYGQFKLWPQNVDGWCCPYQEHVVKNNLFRKIQDMPSHFRTFYAWLFQKIDPKDFLYKGEFFSMTWDQAIMFPIMEMAGDRHYFVPKILYIYNDGNPINDHRVNWDLQKKLSRIIRSKKPYERLDYNYPPNKGKKHIRKIKKQQEVK